MEPRFASPLVLRFGAMGDMVLLTVLLQILAQRYGRPCDILTSGAWGPALLAGQPDVGEVITVPSRTRPYWSDPRQWALVRRLRARPPGPVYVCDLTKQDRLLAWLDRAGIAREHVLLRTPEAAAQRRHWIDCWHEFGQGTPAAWSATPPATHLPHCPKLVVPALARAELARWLRQRGISGPLWLLQPGSKRTHKRGRLAALDDGKWWPPRHWARLARTLLAHGRAAHVLLCGSPSEQPLLRSIAAMAEDARVHAIGDDLPIPRLLALAEAAVGMTTVDTGPAHAAVALGCPAVVLFGGVPRWRWEPRGPTGTTVVALGGAEEGVERIAELAPERVIEASLELPTRGR